MQYMAGARCGFQGPIFAPASYVPGGAAGAKAAPFTKHSVRNIDIQMVA